MKPGTVLVSCVALCLVSSLCLTLCDPMDCSPQGSSVGILQEEYWSGLPCPPPGGLPSPGTGPMFSLPHCRWILSRVSHQGSLLPSGHRLFMGCECDA